MERSLATSEDCAFSLSYFDRIFGGVRDAPFWELVAALADELDDYALAAETATQGVVDGLALAALRHAHQPLVQNLGFEALAAVEQRLKTAAEGHRPEAGREAAALADVARRGARSLRRQVEVSSVTSAPPRGDRGPR